MIIVTREENAADSVTTPICIHTQIFTNLLGKKIFTAVTWIINLNLPFLTSMPSYSTLFIPNLTVVFNETQSEFSY